MAKYDVFYDKSRLIIMSFMYVIYIGLIGALIVYKEINIFLIMILMLITSIFMYLIYTNMKSVLKGDLKYEIDDTGITSHVVKSDSLFFKWSEILKIEVVQIDFNYKISVLAFKKEKETDEGNYYSIMIDGFYFRKSSFEKLYNNLKSTSLLYNKNIIIEECKGYKDTHRLKNK